MKFVNLTPHELNIRCTDGNMMTLAPSGNVARLTTSTVEVGQIIDVVVRITTYGDIENLPAPEAGKVYIVSALVMNQAQRQDVLAPGALIRDENGVVIGCDGLSTVCNELPTEDPDSPRGKRESRKQAHVENMTTLAEIVNPEPIQNITEDDLHEFIMENIMHAEQISKRTSVPYEEDLPAFLSLYSGHSAQYKNAEVEETYNSLGGEKKTIKKHKPLYELTYAFQVGTEQYPREVIELDGKRYVQLNEEEASKYLQQSYYKQTEGTRNWKAPKWAQRETAYHLWVQGGMGDYDR